MATRRANTEGNVYQREDGRFEARLSYFDANTGHRKRASVYGPTRKAALAELEKVKDRLAEGKPPKDATSTVGTWLAHWRATTLAVSDRKASTRELYGNLSRIHPGTRPGPRLALLTRFEADRQHRPAPWGSSGIAVGPGRPGRRGN